VRRGRVLGIDAGERRVGVAMSDPSRLVASPVVVLDRGRGLAPVIDALASLAQREGVVEMVVGLPLNADGSHGPQARRAQHFARVASRVIGVPVSLWDERQSTQEAESIVRAQGRNPRRLRERGQIDAIAAAVILQDFLDHGSPEGSLRVAAAPPSNASAADMSSGEAPPAEYLPGGGESSPWGSAPGKS
jgi:putative holliday junction resolvase